jgi:hypothetical protein
MGALLAVLSTSAAFLLADGHKDTNPTRISDQEGVEHRISKHEPIRNAQAGNLPPQIDLEIVVDTAGQVVSAEPTELWKRLFEEDSRTLR